MKRIKLSQNQFRNTLINEISKDHYNIKNVYHVSDDAFNEFKIVNFDYFFFSDKPIKLGQNKNTYLCNLSIHKPFIFKNAESWDYPLWLYLTDRNGELIPEEEFTREKYDGYLDCPFEFWEIVYYDEDEYLTDQIPKIVKRLSENYDGVIIKDVCEGNGKDYVTDYIVYDPKQVQIIKRW